jgi:2-C-methyl-D-erythritol 2,4-cyclodiphosphate synthase
MKINLANLLNLSVDDIGITATTGEGLTAFGKGEGIQVLCIVSAIQL